MPAPIPSHVERLQRADGHVRGSVEIHPDDRLMRIVLEVDHEHLAPGAREELVEAIFELPDVTYCDVVEAVVPLGDVDLMSSLQAHLRDVRVRAAGATCLIDARRVTRPA